MELLTPHMGHIRMGYQILDRSIKMFNIRYQIFNNNFDDFVGQNGIFQMECNGHLYGEIYSLELVDDIDKVSIYDWFERLIKVSYDLLIRDYVVLSDVESYNTWIEFKRVDLDLLIGIVQSPKKEGTSAIEYFIEEKKYVNWYNQRVSLKQFLEEVVRNATEYLNYVIAHNGESDIFNKQKILIEKLHKQIMEI